MENVRETIVSQYANSPTLVQLIESINAWIDPSINIDAFYNLVWDVDTARGVGLDIWGRIVGVGRVLQVPTGKYFGFDEATTASADPFNQSPFYSGAVLTSNFALSDDGFRVLILAKAMSNICNGSIGAINQILLNLFPNRGKCYVTDGEDMTFTYTFEFVLSPLEFAIVSQSGALPKPAGVSASVVII